jgi:cytochrome c-type biogenesis protein CcmH
MEALKRAIALFFLCAGVSLSAAEAPSPDPALEQRVRTVAEELRCLVCQNQTLADSNADLAVDLRREIREKMRAGMSDKAVIDYLVARYGDFVRYRPPFKSTTLLLWLGPFLLLITGATVLYVNVARRRRRVAETPLSPEEHRRAAELLGKEGETR